MLKQTGHELLHYTCIMRSATSDHHFKAKIVSIMRRIFRYTIKVKYSAEMIFAELLFCTSNATVGVFKNFSQYLVSYFVFYSS